VSYSNINNPANYQLQSFGQDGMRTISTTQAYVEGEYYRVLVATEDSTLSATSMVGDDLASIEVYAGTTIYGLFTAVTVTAGEVTAYLAGRTDIDDVWAYIRAYGEANGATIEGEDCAKAAISPLLDKYYAKASLVMVPSLYKTSIVYSERPLSTDGQLTFTRASSATRVAANGYIEKVRTNVLLQSNSFDTTWTNVNTSETIGQAGYDGTSNAWLLDITGGTATQHIVQSISASGSLTLSVYAKKGSLNWMLLLCAGASFPEAYFDLENGALGTALACTSKIEAAGNGYYRCSISFNTTITDARIYLATGNANVTQSSGNILIQAAQVETGDIATDYIPTTTTAVSVGPVANLPRLNYPINSDGSVGCPSLLLEPQRTNSSQYSEQLDNAYWLKFQATVAANNAVSPDGYTNADKIQENTANDLHYISSGTGQMNASGTYTASLFLKASERSFAWLFIYNGIEPAGLTAFFNLSNGTLGTIDPAITATITDYGNGWYRCTATRTITGNASAGWGFGTATANGTNSYIGTAGSGILAYGGQLEAGSYPTSYIPTLGSTVTRLADAASKSGISYFGQTEGVFFFEFDYKKAQINTSLFATSLNNNDNIYLLALSDFNLRMWVSVGGVNQAVISTGTIPSEGRHKVAMAYKENDCAFYLDGVQIGVDTSCTIPAVENIFLIVPNQDTRQVLVFKTRLSNASLAELTTL
jgi:hypothetical protein